MVRIGTRKSALAIWQANQVKNGLEKNGYSSILIPIESTGDKELSKPIYEIGVQGVFTKPRPGSFGQKNRYCCP